MAPQQRRGYAPPSALTCLVLSALMPPTITASTGLCPLISNPDCSCPEPSPSPAAPNVTCTFTAQVPPPVFSNASAPFLSLWTLNLSHNALDTLSTDFFRGIYTIHTLDLGSNLFPQIPPPLTSMASLKSLDLSHNLVTSLSLPHLASIKGLQTLDLSHNKLTALSSDAQMVEEDDGQFLSLRILNLSWNSIESIDSQVFRPMRHLVVLDLGHNLLPGIKDGTFSPLTFSLNRLDLSHNLLRDLPPMALTHLQHLRDLSLAHNPLRGVEGVCFPLHLRSLDLSHCALTILDHCRLTSLPDLAFIGLRGNHLRCTCQLYLLYEWYQNQHHKAGAPDPSDVGSNWTCTNASLPTTSPTHYGAGPSHVSSAADSASVGEVQLVRDLQQCKDTQSHCQTLEHAVHHPKGSTQMVVTLDVASSGNKLLTSWTFENNGQVPVDGFKLQYMPEDGQPKESPLINVNLRSFIMCPVDLERHYTVCLNVMAYQTTVMHQECRSHNDESLNVITGTLAAIVFLVPCMAFLLYVHIKDRKIHSKWLFHADAEHVSPHTQKNMDDSQHKKGTDDQSDENKDTGCPSQNTVGNPHNKDIDRKEQTVSPGSPQNLDPQHQKTAARPHTGHDPVKDISVTITSDPSPQGNPSSHEVKHNDTSSQAMEKTQAAVSSSAPATRHSHSPASTCEVNNPAFIEDCVSDCTSTDF